ncbi:hypothetical protein [Marinitoga litoralis]|uniref:hypothetical protein n=1 Tax=Marinitoga litoralis TaxID=570855 RepID=UPI0019612971|nr:hypothetical protein [Marinitoga litoralis]MBM7559557.1 hypothetical protein [Marinitoga litoralis]
MKKSIIYLLVILMGVFLLSGCLTKEKMGEENNVLSLLELRNKILENKDVWNNYDSHTTVYETEGIIAYQYVSNSDPTKNYIYIVDENGNGLKLTYLKAENHDGKYNIGDKIKVKGVPYYKTWDYPNIYELRMDVDNLGEIEVLETNFGVPLDKAKQLNSELSGNDFGNLVKFTGKYTSDDNYNNKKFEVNNFEVIVDSHSTLPDMTPNSTYTIKGIVGQNYGYRVFVSDSSWATVVELSQEQSQPTIEASTIAQIKQEIKENYDLKTDGWNSGDTSKVPLRKIENAVVAYDGSNYGYVYAVSSDGTGIYIKMDSNISVNLGDTIETIGRPYYTERDSQNGYFEYRFNTTRSGESFSVLGNGSIPWDKADHLTMNNLPGMDNIGNLVIFEGKYLGKNDYNHYKFDLNDDGIGDIFIQKYSLMPALIENNIYEIKGVVSYYTDYVNNEKVDEGFRIYVGDSAFVTAK